MGDITKSEPLGLQDNLKKKHLSQSDALAVQKQT